MLVNFQVKNYKVFKEEQNFSLVASNYHKEFADTHIITVNDTKLLRGAVIYGANASGKTIFIQALNFVKNFVLESSKDTQAGEAIDVEPFLYHTETEFEPSEFELIFLYKNIRYRYGFEVNHERVLSEWLYVKDKREVEYFYRDEATTTINKSKFDIGQILSDKKMVRENALLLSVAAQFNDPTALNVLEWMEDFRLISGLHSELYRAFTMSNMRDQPAFAKRVLTFLQQADLGIDGIEIDDYQEEYNLEQAVTDILLGGNCTTYHKKYDTNNRPLPERVRTSMRHSESAGTHKFFNLAGIILDTLDRGSVMVVDELDARLHSNLVAHLVKLFHDPSINKQGAQLVFATHNTNLLSNRSLRRDQIWFVNKDRYGASKLYSLGDFKSTVTRQEDNYEKKYLEGIYGGTPYISSFNSNTLPSA
jgi:AAA15 family ATPase/GTPase